MISTAARSELLPQDTLRVGINFGNALLVRKDAAGPRGIVIDLARELAQRLTAPMDIVSYPSAGRMADGASAGEWDVAFLATDPERAEEIAFSAPYLEVDTTYLVPDSSTLHTTADVDREGIRIALSAKSAYDLFLARNLARAELVRAITPEASVELFFSQKLDALAGLRPLLMDIADQNPGTRVLNGSFTIVRQAAGVPRGRQDAALYIQDFVEDIKRSGLVRKLMASNGVRGASVAPLISSE
jgi:polar amino acid transport system substrate-binding protein